MTPEIEAKIKLVMAEQLEVAVDALQFHVTLEALNADSLAIVETILGLEQTFDIEISEQAVGEAPTVGGMIAIVDHAMIVSSREKTVRAHCAAILDEFDRWLARKVSDARLSHSEMPVLNDAFRAFFANTRTAAKP